VAAAVPGKASIINNLALISALEGNRDAAESLLKRAAQTSNGNARIKQNLAMVRNLPSPDLSVPQETSSQSPINARAIKANIADRNKNAPMVLRPAIQ